MNYFLRIAATLMCAAFPARAEVMDDATCGAISEYVMDLAYGKGVPMVLEPQGTTGAEGQNCFLTDIKVNYGGPVTIKVDKVQWSGTGLMDWVRGEGWPSDVSLEFKGARSTYDDGSFPVASWLTDLNGQRSALQGRAKAHWNADDGKLDLETGFLQSRNNIANITGSVSGLAEGPVSNSFNTLTLHNFKADIQLDGAFENLVLSPLLYMLPEGQTAPQAAFEALRDTVRTYVASLPSPPVDASSVTAMQVMLDSLPSPTGQMNIDLDAPEGLRLITIVPLVVGKGAPTPDGLADIITRFAGDTRLAFGWRPGLRIK